MKPGPLHTPLDPLARKLGLKEGQRVLVLNTPGPYSSLFTSLPGVRFLAVGGEGQADFIHLFAFTFEALETGLELASRRLKQNGMLWISWPKQASGVSSEIGKTDVLLAGQGAGLVDVKVASVNETWSGHKFVVPLAQRK